jgi:hypothetical protein
MEYGHIFDLSLIIKCYVLYIENGEADCYSTLEFRVYNLSFFHVILDWSQDYASLLEDLNLVATHLALNIKNWKGKTIVGLGFSTGVFFIRRMIPLWI